MELKEYQQGVLSKLDRYLTVLQEQREQAEDFVEFQQSKGKTATLGDYCRETWDQLNAERLLPYLYHGDQPVVAPHLSRHDGLAAARLCWLPPPWNVCKQTISSASLGWFCGSYPLKPSIDKPGSNWRTANTPIGKCWSELPVAG